MHGRDVVADRNLAFLDGFVFQCFLQSLRISELEEKMKQMISDAALSDLADGETNPKPQEKC